MEVRHDCTDPRTNQAGRDRHRYDREVCHRTVAILRPDVIYGNGLERGELTWEQYVSQYGAILARTPDVVWNTLAAQPEARLLCYCRDGVPCHTHLIIEYAVGIWPDRFRDGRT